MTPWCCQNKAQIPTPALGSLHPPAFPRSGVCLSPWAPISAASSLLIPLSTPVLML